MAVKIPYLVNESIGSGKIGGMNMTAPDFTGIAKAIGATGDMATEFFTKKQMELNDTVARKVQTDMTNKALELEAELAKYKGEQAIGKQAEMAKQWEDFVRSYSESEGIAGNANHLRAVEFFGSKFGGDLSNTAAKYELAQMDVFRGATLERSQDTLTARVAGASQGKGWHGISANMAEIDDLAAQKSALTGKGVDFHRAEILSGALLSYARQEQNPDVLMSAVEAASGLVDENTRAQLEVMAKGKLDTKSGQDFGMQAFSDGMTSLQFIKAVNEKFGDNDAAKASAIGTYNQFNSAKQAERSEYDRIQRERLNAWSADGGIGAPAGIDPDWVKRNLGMSISDYAKKAADSTPVSTAQLIDAQSILGAGLAEMSRLPTLQARKDRANEIETGLMRISPKLAQQYAPQIAEWAVNAGKPEYFKGLSDSESALSSVWFQLKGKKYKAGDSTTDDALYNSVLLEVMSNPALRTPDGVKQTFLDKSRLVDSSKTSDKSQRASIQLEQRKAVLKDAVLLSIDINAQNTRGYQLFANRGMLTENGVLMPKYRAEVAQASQVLYEMSLSDKRNPYGRNPTVEEILFYLDKKREKSKR